MLLMSYILDSDNFIGIQGLFLNKTLTLACRSLLYRNKTSNLKTR